MSADAGPIPPGVAGEAERLEAALNVKPTFESLGSNVWRVTFTNERVQVTFDLRDSKRGFDQLESTLSVDGKPRKLARDLKQLTAFFTDTTATLEALKVEVVVPPEANVKEAPAAVQHIYGKLAVQHKQKDMPLRLSHPEPDLWVIGFYMDNGAVELMFVRRGKKWGVSKQPRLILDGEDWSDEVQSLEEAIRLLMGGMNPVPADTHPSVKPRGAQSTPTSVQVRKTTVIRT